MYKERQIALSRLGALILCMHNYHTTETILTNV